MAVALVRVGIPAIDTLLDESSIHWVYQNTGTSSVSVGDATALMTAAASFYSVVPSGYTNPWSRSMSTSLNWAHGADCSVYDITGHLNGTPHGAPVASQVVTSIGPAPSGPSPMPEGVCIALSYRRDYGTDVEFVRDPVTHKVTSRPRGQDRSRVYIGPLAPSCFTTDPTTNRTKVEPVHAAELMACMQSIATVHVSVGTYTLAQWSRKKGNVAAIVQQWVDDRPDYQRRRADQSTVRYTSTMSYPA